MNVLILGGGGREHAFAWKISQSPKVEKIYCAPGNAGTESLAKNVDIGVTDFEKMAKLVQEKNIDLTVVGPEVPLTEGVVDYFKENGLIEKGHKIFGPHKKAAQLEGSKIFAKQLMQKYNIPTAQAEFFTNSNEAIKYLKKNFREDNLLVIKADGLAAGKGVILPKTLDEAQKSIKEIMEEKIFGEAGNQISIEERLYGQEASILALTDGKTIKTLISSQDHKAIYDGDKGPNTGGMGAYAPAPIVTPELEKIVFETILKPTIEGLKKEGIPYVGCLYAGLMIDEKNEPSVIEFNCRFGDPETQPVLTMLESDLVELIVACAEGNLNEKKIKNKPGGACTVVMAAGGYPGNYEKGKVITGLDNVLENVYVFHAGTKKENDQIFTDGGRVLGVTGYGESIKTAIDKAYKGVNQISWEDEYHRKDIGQKAL